jgi:hypothetical protein
VPQIVPHMEAQLVQQAQALVMLGFILKVVKVP